MYQDQDQAPRWIPAQCLTSQIHHLKRSHGTTWDGLGGHLLLVRRQLWPRNLWAAAEGCPCIRRHLVLLRRHSEDCRWVLRRRQRRRQLRALACCRSRTCGLFTAGWRRQVCSNIRRSATITLVSPSPPLPAAPVLVGVVLYRQRAWLGGWRELAAVKEQRTGRRRASSRARRAVRILFGCREKVFRHRLRNHGGCGPY